MARYLVVAHQTVTSPELVKQVRVLREQDKDAEFVLLVPATPVRHLLLRRGDEHDAEATARKRAERGRAPRPAVDPAGDVPREARPLVPPFGGGAGVLTGRPAVTASCASTPELR